MNDAIPQMSEPPAIPMSDEMRAAVNEALRKHYSIGIAIADDFVAMGFDQHIAFNLAINALITGAARIGGALIGVATIDKRLVLGSTMFGVGWGLAGFCPGPALTALGMGEPKALLFVAAMLAGMGIYEVLERRRIAPPSTQAR